MVQITKQIQNRFDAEMRLLRKMYEQLSVGDVHEWMSIRKAVDLFEEKEGTVANSLVVFEDLGILHREIEYPGFQKQNVKWTLLVPRHEAVTMLETWHRQVAMSSEYRRFPKHEVQTRAKSPQRTNGVAPEERVALAEEPASEGQELVASAGPEAESPFEALRPLRKDESKALVEAARQYANKGKFLADKIAELQREGFEIAPGALSLKRDERLEAVAMAIPYIDSLESMNTRLLSQNNGARETARQYEDLRIRFERLKRENDRLVAKSVTSGQQVMAGA